MTFPQRVRNALGRLTGDSDSNLESPGTIDPVRKQLESSTDWKDITSEISLLDGMDLVACLNEKHPGWVAAKITVNGKETYIRNGSPDNPDDKTPYISSEDGKSAWAPFLEGHNAFVLSQLKSCRCVISVLPSMPGNPGNDQLEKRKKDLIKELGRLEKHEKSRIFLNCAGEPEIRKIKAELLSELNEVSKQLSSPSEASTQQAQDMRLSKSTPGVADAAAASPPVTGNDSSYLRNSSLRVEVTTDREVQHGQVTQPMFVSIPDTSEESEGWVSFDSTAP